MAEEDHFIIVKGEVGSEECGLTWADECIKLSPVVVESGQSDGDEEDECQLVNDP